ncbi:hypothetical protein ACBY01_06585 [Sphingomonas sp. ac-8]|uniref:hypothetical protein n=1 Tax=Sphingomonas sp. ac-8 TaxID=3242977 RepID=UPI003A80A132
MIHRSRRTVLLVAAGVLLAANAVFLFAHMPAPAAGARPALSLRIESVGFSVPPPGDRPILADGGWERSGRAVPDLRRFADETAVASGNMTRDGPILFVGLGEAQTFGHYVRTLHAMKEAGICHAVVWEKDPEGDAPLLTLCGDCVGHLCA